MIFIASHSRGHIELRYGKVSKTKLLDVIRIVTPRKPYSKTCTFKDLQSLGPGIVEIVEGKKPVLLSDQQGAVPSSFQKQS